VLSSKKDFTDEFRFLDFDVRPLGCIYLRMNPHSHLVLSRQFFGFFSSLCRCTYFLLSLRTHNTGLHPKISLIHAVVVVERQVCANDDPFLFDCSDGPSGLFQSLVVIQKLAFEQ
jgi:hypothetical protein